MNHYYICQKKIIINAGGLFEYGGDCVDQDMGVLKLAQRSGLTETIIASLFSDIFKDGDPQQLWVGFEKRDKGIIVATTDGAENKLKEANEKLKKLRDESFKKLESDIGITSPKTKLTKDQARKLSDYCLSQNINNIGVITVAAPNFNPDLDGDNEYFNATKQKYVDWTSKEREEYFTKMFQNICDKIIEQIEKTTETEIIVYFKAPGVGIFNPFKKREATRQEAEDEITYDVKDIFPNTFDYWDAIKTAIKTTIFNSDHTFKEHLREARQQNYVELVNKLMIKVLHENKGKFNEALGDEQKLIIKVDKNIRDKVFFQEPEVKESARGKDFSSSSRSTLPKVPDIDDLIIALSKLNKDAYSQLRTDKEDFLNPEKYVGWGARLEKDDNLNSFTITEVIPGGFVAAIGLKIGDKIQVNSDELRKDGVDLEAALIYRLREGKLDDITKMGDYDLSNESHKEILASYSTNCQRVFTKDGTNYKLAEKQTKVKDDKKFQEDVRPKILKNTDYIVNIIFSKDKEGKKELLNLLLEDKSGLSDKDRQKFVHLILRITEQGSESEKTKPSSSPRLVKPLIKNNGTGLKCGYYAIAAGILQLNDADRERIYEKISFDTSLLKKDVDKDQYVLGDAIDKYVANNEREILDSKFERFIDSMKKGGSNKDEIDKLAKEILVELKDRTNICADRMELICSYLEINLKLNGSTYGLEQLEGYPTIEIFNQGNHYEARDMRGGRSQEARDDRKER